MSATDILIPAREAHDPSLAATMPTIHTWFGRFTYDPAKTLSMPQGPVGYSDRNTFVFLNVPGAEEGIFKIFQAVDDPGLSFIVVPAANVGDPIAEADLRSACAAYGIAYETAATILIAALHRNADGTSSKTVNLQAPILVDVPNRWAHQLIFANKKYPVSAPLG